MKFFLDIDGVMVHANPHKTVELDKDGFYKFNQTAINVLNSVLISMERTNSYYPLPIGFVLALLIG